MINLIKISLLCIPVFVFSQKIGYIDSDLILEQMGRYKESQSRLDGQIGVWQKEIEEKQNAVDLMKKKFIEEKILLTDDQIVFNEKEIADKEKEVKDLIEKRFGVEGEAIKFRANSAKPVQDQIFNATKVVCEKNKFDWIFNKGGAGIGFMYTSGKNDVTNLVLKELGFDVESKIKEAKKKEKEQKTKDKEKQLKEKDQIRKDKADALKAKLELAKAKREELKNQKKPKELGDDSPEFEQTNIEQTVDPIKEDIKPKTTKEEKNKPTEIVDPNKPKGKAYGELTEVEKIKRKKEQLEKIEAEKKKKAEEEKKRLREEKKRLEEENK